MIEVTIKTSETIPVRFIRAECGVRYWEDASVDGLRDWDGSRIPFRNGDAWSPLIDLETGKIEGWPPGTTAQIHYKVCDDGAYELLDAEKKVVRRITGYVPKIMSPDDNGYGDYIIMTVDGAGQIQNWRVDLSSFEEEADELREELGRAG